MTPAEKARASDIIAKATPGEWHFENVNWIGPTLFSVYASDQPNLRGTEIFSNISPDAKGYDNMEFVTAARSLLPKAMAQIDALEQDIQSGKTQTAANFMTAADIAQAKKLLANATGGTWSWEDDSRLGDSIRTVYAGRDPGMHGLNLFGRMYAANDADLDFMTASRSLLPEAIAHIETLEAALKLNRAPASPKKYNGGMKP